MFNSFLFLPLCERRDTPFSMRTVTRSGLDSDDDAAAQAETPHPAAE